MSDSKLQVIERAIADQVAKTRNPIDRRRFFVSAAAFGAAIPAIASTAAAQQLASNALPAGAPPDTLHHSMRKAVGRSRSNFAKDLAQLVDLNAFNQGGAYWNYKTYITPIDQFFVRNEFATPRPEFDRRVDKRFWTLRVHGDAVERELTITYDQLLAMPSRSLICTMECAGNGRTLFWEQQGMVAGDLAVGGTGWGLGGIGQAEWQYVPISYILDLVGIKSNAKSVLFWSGVDNKDDRPGAAGDRGRPVPATDIRNYEGVIGLAFKMNGQDLPADHGGPVRALVPGYCGAASTKWLTEIKIASHNFWVPLNSRAHVMIGPNYPPPIPQPGDEFRFVKPDGILGQAVTWSPPKSLITVPLVLERQPKYPHNYPLEPGQLPKLAPGQQTIRGYAWAPRFGVRKVEYRIDGGGWRQARIEAPNLGRFTWVRFDFPWAPAAGRYRIETRVTDRKGNRQPEIVPFNKGGFDFWATPKFRVEVV